jgi:hypothetical protein
VSHTRDACHSELATGQVTSSNRLLPRLVDDAPEAQLAKPGSHVRAPGHPIGLVELGNGRGADRHGGQAC